MARTTIPAASIITPVGPYPTLQPAANSLDLVFQAADTVNQNQFALGFGKYVVLARNTHATTTYTVTFTSAVDPRTKRSGNITAYSLEAGDQMAFLIDSQDGWKQTDGMFYLEANNASVQFCILRIT